MALCMAHTRVCVTRNDTRPPSTMGRHKHRGTHPRTHIQGPGKCETMGDGGIQPRGTWTSVSARENPPGGPLGKCPLLPTSTPQVGKYPPRKCCWVNRPCPPRKCCWVLRVCPQQSLARPFGAGPHGMSVTCAHNVRTFLPIPKFQIFSWLCAYGRFVACPYFGLCTYGRFW